MTDSLDSEIANFVDGLIEVESLKERERRLKKLVVVKNIALDLAKAVFSISLLKGCAWALLASLAMKYFL